MLPEHLHQHGDVYRVDLYQGAEIFEVVVEVIADHDVEGVVEEGSRLFQIALHLRLKIRLDVAKLLR
ncbi:hypothetical protein SDC9_134848 [bioreactor metagenome]|uniref:Uncharacterized protein n=1 Tax=bioreactor metagenome TaxID=1076179 RepID=A0A645DFD8_9ZZZZ